MELSTAVFLIGQLAFEQLPKAHPIVHCLKKDNNGLTNCLLQCCRSRSDIMRDIVYDLGMRQICRKNNSLEMQAALYGNALQRGYAHKALRHTKWRDSQVGSNACRVMTQSAKR